MFREHNSTLQVSWDVFQVSTTCRRETKLYTWVLQIKIKLNLELKK
jgi:hypothetical protein